MQSVPSGSLKLIMCFLVSLSELSLFPSSLNDQYKELVAYFYENSKVVKTPL